MKNILLALAVAGAAAVAFVPVAAAPAAAGAAPRAVSPVADMAATIMPIADRNPHSNRRRTVIRRGRNGRRNRVYVNPRPFAPHPNFEPRRCQTEREVNYAIYRALHSYAHRSHYLHSRAVSQNGCVIEYKYLACDEQTGRRYLMTFRYVGLRRVLTHQQPLHGSCR